MVSRSTVIAGALLAAASLGACSEMARLAPIEDCAAGASAVSVVPPIFIKPFAGDYPVTNIFDHDEPLPNVDTNDFQLSTCGQKIESIVRGHNGYDFPMPIGTPVLAVSEGTIALAGRERPINCPALHSTVSGLTVVIRIRATRTVTIDAIYGHLDSVGVNLGDSVHVGDVIGLSGNTGCSTGPHLHFGAARFFTVRGEVMIDPYGWSGIATDPWAVHSSGTSSMWLWREGQAPRLFR